MDGDLGLECIARAGADLYDFGVGILMTCLLAMG